MTIKKLYKESWKFIKTSRVYLWIILGLFAASIAFGFLFPVFFTDFITKFIEETLAKTQGLGFWQLFLFILENNILTSAFGMLFGLFFGLIPLVLVFFNGYVLGFVASKSVAASGASVLLRLVPHGIFEIPALILSLGLGLRLGLFLFTRKKKFLDESAKILKTFLLVVLPLLIIAALIETCLIIFAG